MKSNETLKISDNKEIFNINSFQNPEKFIKIEKNNIRKIYEKLKELGFKSVREIENYLGASFRNPLYYGSLMREKDFFKLKNLLGVKNIKSIFKCNKIPHKIIIGRTEQIKLKDNEDVAELITIMLGDGNLGLDGIYISIALNNIDDPAYVIYVRKLLTKIFKDVYIAEKNIKDSKGYVLIINSKAVYQALISKGLIPGDKVINQVDTPEWIYSKSNNILRSLKGLFDTDGSIRISKKSKSLILSFSNASKPLVESFKKMCNKLGIHTGRVNGPYISKDNRSKSESKMYMVTIEAKEQVKKFLKIVDPEKFKELYRYYWLGLNLLILEAPNQVKKKFRQAIEKYKMEHNIKKFQYSKRNTIFLKNLCKKELEDILPNIDSNVIKTIIVNEIRKALMLNPYGGIHLMKQEDKVERLPSNIRNYVCNLIYKIISNNKDMSRELILSDLIEKILDSNNHHLITDLKTLRYNIALSNYFSSLIIMIRKIKRCLINKEEVSPTRIVNELDLPFGRKVVERIIKGLRNNFPEDFKTL